MEKPSRTANALEEPLWRRYERSVQKLLSALDPGASVSHDQRVRGNLSQTGRQVDIWVIGKVAGLEISIAVECKKLKRAATVEVIDQFFGKLIDIGADRGIVYSYSGFTNSAVSRAIGAHNPAMLAVSVTTPDIIASMRGAPGYPSDLLVQEMAPQWIEELDEFAMRDFLAEGRWSKFWS